jgi:hypothetical protein
MSSPGRVWVFSKLCLLSTSSGFSVSGTVISDFEED